MFFQLWARSLARIKASASGAENPGFKSQRARFLFSSRKIEDLLNVLNEAHLPQTNFQFWFNKSILLESWRQNPITHIVVGSYLLRAEPDRTPNVASYPRKTENLFSKIIN
jgi:hypothetical protein